MGSKVVRGAMQCFTLCISFVYYPGRVTFVCFNFNKNRAPKTSTNNKYVVMC